MTTGPGDEHRRGHVAPRRRTYKDDPARSNPVDSVERVRLWGPLVIGAGIGLTWGAVAGGAYYGSALVGGAVGMLVGVAVMWLMILVWVGAAGRSVKSVLIPSGKSTAFKRQYSDAEAADARGDSGAALAAYQRYVVDEPADPEPYFRIARLCRDKLEDYDQAADWYRRVRRETQLDAGHDLLATQDLIEIYIHKLRQPRKAIPELARIVERYPDTPPARGAATELARLRALMADDEDGESLTGRFYKE